MMKRLFVIGLTIFILSNGLDIVTTKEIKKDDRIKNYTNDLPDLTVEIYINYTDLFCTIEVIAKNIGSGTIAPNTQIVVRIHYPDRTVWLAINSDSPIYPGEWIPILSRTLPYRFYKGKVVRAVIDPSPSRYADYPKQWIEEYKPDPYYGIIKESNEDNNECSKKIPKIRCAAPIGLRSVERNIFSVLKTML